MKLAHLADLHLGRRQFNRTTPGGMNAREADVQDAVRRVVDDLLDVRPDVVLIAGDVFDSVRPPNASVVFLFQQLQRLRAALPDTRVVMISGNHDSPRSIDSASILPLFRALGVDVVTRTVERIPLPGCTVTCVPSSAAKQMAEVVPDPAAAVNILLLHAAMPGAGYGKPEVTDAQVQAFDYVALGDYHVMHQVGPRAWYAGSLEWTSSDPWSEVRERDSKGYLLVELPGGDPTFRPIATRRFLDLSPVDADGFSPAQLDAAMAAALGAVALDGAVVRLVVLNVPRDLQRAIDYKAYREWKAKAFHLQVDFRRPEAQAVTPEGRAIRRKRLEQIVDEFFGARALPADVDRQALQALGQEYLAAVSDEHAPLAESAA